MTQESVPQSTPVELREEWLHRLDTLETLNPDIRTESRLKKGGGQENACFCALGVGAQVLVDHGLAEWVGERFDVGDGEDWRAELPLIALSLLGFPDVKETDRFQAEIAEMNDRTNRTNWRGYVYTWPEIANHIREYVKEESN